MEYGCLTWFLTAKPNTNPFKCPSSFLRTTWGSLLQYLVHFWNFSLLSEQLESLNYLFFLIFFGGGGVITSTFKSRTVFSHSTHMQRFSHLHPGKACAPATEGPLRGLQVNRDSQQEDRATQRAERKLLLEHV